MTDEIISLLTESANLLVVGMVVVFVFLVVLIGVVKLMSFVVQKYPEPTTQNNINQVIPSTQKTPGVSNRKLQSP